MRDCAFRGIRAILIEKDDIASGTSGRNHGLLHSGARYAVTDPVSAKECIQENRILKQIARHCVEETDGLFITLPEDDAQFQQTLIQACQQSGIETEKLTREETLRYEPSLNPDLISAVRVPDGTIDPFRLCSANLLDATNHGGKIFTHTQVIGLLQSQIQIIGVKCIQSHSNEIFEIYAAQVINAAGIWGQHIAEYADLKVPMYPVKGSLLVLDYRLNQMVLNRCHPPADGDILVPGDTVSIIGTTSTPIQHHMMNHLSVTHDEVDQLLQEGEKIIPDMANIRILRAYAGIRPLICINQDPSENQAQDEHQISRGIVLLDHQTRDGLDGFITLGGGKLITCRLMAEMATDLVAKKLSNTTPCITAQMPLINAKSNQKTIQTNASHPIAQTAYYRHGDQAKRFLPQNENSTTLICECEMVTSEEIHYAIENLQALDLSDLRRRTRLGMGPCQGEMCAYRAACCLKTIASSKSKITNSATQLLIDFLQERWQGTHPILWGDALREFEYSYWIYESLQDPIESKDNNA